MHIFICILCIYLNINKGGVAVREFFEKYRYTILLLAIGVFVVIAKQNPFLWGVLQVDFGIGYWIGHLNYTSSQAFLLGTVTGNIECLAWYWFMGKLMHKGRAWAAEQIAIEKNKAECADIWHLVQRIVEYAIERALAVIDPETYRKRWAFRLLERLQSKQLFGSLARLLLYAVMISVSAVPGLMFIVMAFVHGFKKPRGLAAILVGNTCKIAYFAYIIWPAIFSAAKSLQF